MFVLRSLLPCLLALCLICISGCYASDQGKIVFKSPAKSKEAYVTLIYGESFVLGARVLGRSLKETKTTRDMVALCTDSISEASEKTLAGEGWRVARVATVENPGRGPQAGKGFPSRFWAVYTKLYIFTLTEYRKVAFLDADVLVLQNMDAIFRCPGFCAALRHSERFNTGVMTLEPSHEVFEDIMANIKKMPSYTGGDQGFLNSYFTGLAHGPLFDPKASYTPEQYKYMRLPTTFNADVGLYVVGSNRWMIPRSSIYAIHYTLATFKPWVWWTGWLVRENPAWDAVRARLPTDALGYAGGRTARQVFAESVLVPLPLIGALAAFLFFAYRSPDAFASFFSIRNLGRGLMSSASSYIGVSSCRRRSPASSGAPAAAAAAVSAALSVDVATKQYCLAVDPEVAGGSVSEVTAAAAAAGIFPRGFLPLNLLAGYGCVGAAFQLTMMLVPSEVAERYGWILSFEYGFLFLTVLYGMYLRVCFRWGASTANSAATGSAVVRGGGARLPWSFTLWSAAFFFVLLLVAPFTGRVLGVKSFVGNIIATVFTGLPAVLFATLLFTFLPSLWFLAGCNETDARLLD